MSAGNYTIFEIDLTVAGNESIDGPWQLLRFLDAVDGAGAIVATAKLKVRAGRDEEDSFPMRIGNAVRLLPATKLLFVEWDAQAGVIATLGLSADAAQVDWDSDPPAQVTSISGTVATEETKGATLTGSGDDTILTAVTETIAADTDQRELIIQADDGNTGVLMLRDGANANGFELAAGASLILSTSDAVQVRNDSGATQTYRFFRVKD